MIVVHFWTKYIAMVTHVANLICSRAGYVWDKRSAPINTPPTDQSVLLEVASPIIEDPMELSAWIVRGSLLCRDRQSPLAVPDNFLCSDIDSRQREWLSFLSHMLSVQHVKSHALTVPQTGCFALHCSFYFFPVGCRNVKAISLCFCIPISYNSDRLKH